MSLVVRRKKVVLTPADAIRALVAAGNHAVSRRNCDAEIGAEPVRGVVVNREPPGGIQQKPEVRMEGGELDAENGRVLVARQAAFIRECQTALFALRNG